jgi:hypothetical protein
MIRPAMCIMLAAALFAGAAFGEEAGAYQRKSISFIDALWYADQQSRAMSQAYRSALLASIKDALLLSRFDRNPLPDALTDEFLSRARAIQAAGGDAYLDSLSACISSTLTPAILKVIEETRAERGKRLQTEQQKNSFMSDKAREMGLTAKQIDRLMNSAFVFIPLCRGFKESTANGNRSAEMEIGVVLFRIETGGDDAQAAVALKKFVFCSGSATVGKSYYHNGKKVTARQYAFASAVDNGIMNLTVALQKVDEFRLSTQVTQRRPGRVAFTIGESEGVMVDDRYRIVEAIEQPDGTVKRRKHGWVMVRKIGAHTESGPAVSWAQVIAGRPRIGSVLDEYPRIPLQLSVGSALFPASTAKKNHADAVVESLDVSHSLGFRAALSVNLGRLMKFPQFFFEAGYAMGFGDAVGTAAIAGEEVVLTRFMNMHFEGSLAKKWYMRRLAVILKPGFSYAQVTVHPSMDLTGDMSYRLKGYALGFLGEGGLELAVAPAVNLGLSAGYGVFTPTIAFSSQSRYTGGDWADYAIASDQSGNGIDLSGLRIGAYLDVSLPGLPNDPIKALGHRIAQK